MHPLWPLLLLNTSNIKRNWWESCDGNYNVIDITKEERREENFRKVKIILRLNRMHISKSIKSI